MSKILNVNELLQAAHDSDLPEYDRMVVAFEDLTRTLADTLAMHLSITCFDVSYQSGFAGLCATFMPAHDGQTCPQSIDDGDPGGSWG